MPDPKNEELKFGLDETGDRVVISVGVNMLAYAIMMGNNWPEDFVITDPPAFAAEFVHEIDRSEDEEGSNALHRVFDELANDIIESGSEEGITEYPDDEGVKLEKRVAQMMRAFEKDRKDSPVADHIAVVSELNPKIDEIDEIDEIDGVMETHLALKGAGLL